MSVDHYLLPVMEDELASILAEPETIHQVVDGHEDEVCRLFQNAKAIMFLTAADVNDPLLFLESGGPPEIAGWIGEYVVEDDRVVTCEADMGYGPASYYRNEFIVAVAQRLRTWTVEKFAERCDLDLLEEQYIYPLDWQEPGRREDLIQSFTDFRECVIATAESGKHLLSWAA
ncbi:MAG: DUF1877 family protein [Pirellulaceae bacterium]